MCWVVSQHIFSFLFTPPEEIKKQTLVSKSRLGGDECCILCSLKNQKDAPQMCLGFRLNLASWLLFLFFFISKILSCAGSQHR